MKNNILMAVLILSALAINGCSSKENSEKYAGQVEKINFGVVKNTLSTLVWIAENKDYFQENHLDVKIKEFDSGVASLNAMLHEQSDLDMITAAQGPVMFNSFNSNDFSIIGSVFSSYNNIKIITHEHKGIKTPRDLKGKKIGVTKGSTGHFFLSLFLTYNGLLYSDIEIVDFKASELAQALSDGKVDAISTWYPHILDAQKLLGKNAVIFENQGIFRDDFYFVVDKDFVETNPETLKRFLKAIKQAEKFVKENKEESIDIVSQRLNIDREDLSLIWDDFNLQLTLDQSIIITLEDEARWAIQNNLTNATEIPNYLNYIYTDALEKVKPEAITIIR